MNKKQNNTKSLSKNKLNNPSKKTLIQRQRMNVAILFNLFLLAT